MSQTSSTDAIWGPYPDFDDVARFQYGRRMWRLPEMRKRLLAHWTDERHPYRKRFEALRPLIEKVLMSDQGEAELDQQLRKEAEVFVAWLARFRPSLEASLTLRHRSAGD